MPVGRCVSLTPVSTLLRCCPPGPPATKNSRSQSRSSDSLSVGCLFIDSTGVGSGEWGKETSSSHSPLSSFISSHSPFPTPHSHLLFLPTPHSLLPIPHSLVCAHSAGRANGGGKRAKAR